jgi:hypothetical protein
MKAAKPIELNMENNHSSEQGRLKWQIDFIEELGIVRVKTKGLMDWEYKRKLCEEMLAAGRKNNMKAFLVDQKESVFGLSVLEIDRLPVVLKDIGFTQQDKLAVLVNPDSLKDDLFKFLQNVCVLKSMQIRVFDDAEKATTWLKKKT